MKMIFVSSNPYKIKEVKRILPNIKIEKGKDLREIDSDDPKEIVLYKAKEAGKNYLVEDVVMTINGVLRNDIKWIHQNLKKNSKVEWIVTYGYNDGLYIYIFSDSLKGKIVDPKGNSKFGFDMIFEPENSNGKTLAELEEMGIKDKFSARMKALMKVKKFQYDEKIKIKNIPEWKGFWQNE